MEGYYKRTPEDDMLMPIPVIVTETETVQETFPVAVSDRSPLMQTLFPDMHPLLYLAEWSFFLIVIYGIVIFLLRIKAKHF